MEGNKMKQLQNKPLYFVLLIAVFLLVPSMLVHAGGAKIQEKLDRCKEEKTSLEAKVSELEDDNQSLKSQLDSLEAEKTGLEKRIAELENLIAQKEKEVEAIEAEAPDPMIVSKTVEEAIQEKEAEIIQLKMQKDELETNVQQINREIAQLKSRNQALMSEVSDLRNENSEMQTENNSIRMEARSLEVENQQLSQRIDSLSAENQELEAVVAGYEKILSDRDEMMDLALEMIHEILKDEIRSGRVRVLKGTLGITLDIQGEHMFDVGSVEINPSSKVILGKIARLFKQLDDYYIGILGNADSKPIITPSLKAKYPTNWELSAIRGVSVTRYLMEVGGIDPKKMISMGAGEYQTRYDNSTRDGRGDNRRVDIILLPRNVLAEVVVGAELK
jgi:chemotaxis protein MotB